MANMVPRIAPHVAWQIVDGEAVIVDLSSGKSLGLNATGTFLWSQINGGRDSDSIAASMAAEFEISSETAASDTKEFLSEMSDRALILNDESTP